MGENEINMGHGAQFTGRRTLCGQEWARMRSTWVTVLNLQDDALPVSENGGE